MGNRGSCFVVCMGRKHCLLYSIVGGHQRLCTYQHVWASGTFGGMGIGEIACGTACEDKEMLAICVSMAGTASATVCCDCPKFNFTSDASGLGNSPSFPKCSWQCLRQLMVTPTSIHGEQQSGRSAAMSMCACSHGDAATASGALAAAPANSRFSK